MRQVTWYKTYMQKPVVHGHARTGHRSPEYVSWQAMLARCLDPRHKSFPNYGGRGIQVCSRWLNSFADFYQDMGDRPTPTTSLEREDPNGDYEPGNCRWATPKEQGRNRRNNIRIAARGKVQAASEWAEDLGVTANSLYIRRRKGWSDADIINTPVKGRMPPAQAKRIYNEYAKGSTTLEALAEKYGSTVAAVQAITSGRNHSASTGASYTPGKKRVYLKKTPALLRKVKKMLETMSRRKVAEELGVSRTVIVSLQAML